MKRALAFILIIIALLGLFSCKGKEPVAAPDVYYTVSFTTTLLPYSVMAPASQSVKAGESASAPSFGVEPSGGYVLIWTADPVSLLPYDFTRPVEGDLLLYAAETPRTYRITYLTERGTVPAANPTSFTKETPTFSLAAVRLDYDEDFGYQFLDWSYYDDPNSAVSEIEQGGESDLILRAKITPIEYEVYYKEAGEGFDGAKTYLFGSTMSLESPSREGYVFTGWTIYMDASRTPVTTLTPEFVKQHRAALFRGSGNGIGLLANWEEEE